MNPTFRFSSFFKLLFATCVTLVTLATTARAAAKPTIYAFNVYGETTINRGTTATLNWSVSTGATVSLAPDIGVVQGTEVSVTPLVTTTYTLTATNAAGSVTQVKKITVIVPPVFQSLTATPATVTAGTAVKLSWSASGANYFTLTADQGADPGNVFANSVTVRPKATTTYTVKAVNTAGTDVRAITIPVIVAGAKPVIATFASAPSVILAGEAATLSWNVTGATALSISPGVGAVTGTSVSVNPVVSTTYTLTATNQNGSVTKTTAVTVQAATPVINGFAAQPAAIVEGQFSTLSWSTTGATSVAITANVGQSPGAVTGSTLTVSPAQTTTYTLTAANPSGAAQRSVVVAVSKPEPLPAITAFKASPVTIDAGESTTLSWSVTGANGLSIAADVGASPGPVTGASTNVSPTADTVYTLMATNSTGTVVLQTTVKVNRPEPVVRSFVSNPAAINAGESTTLFWDVVGAVSYTITADRGESPGVVTGNSVTVQPAATTLYTLIATSAGGVDKNSVTQVTVSAPPPPPVPIITFFQATPTTIAVGASARLAWSITDATTVAITADHGASPGVVTGDSVDVQPADTTTYTVVATNAFGNSTQTATVTVTGPMPPVISSFIASPAFVPEGGTAVLKWVVSGADTMALAADHGEVTGVLTGDTLTVTPAVTTVYTLTATNAVGTSKAEIKVTLYTPGSGHVEHPRIWVTPASLILLQQRASANDPAWIRLRNACDAYATMPVRYPDEAPASGTIHGGYQFNDYLQPSEELALGYLVARVVDPVRAARYAAKEKELLLALADPVRHGRTSTDSGYGIRSYVPALALGYDWIHDMLTEAERVQIYTEINRWDDYYKEEGYGRNFPQGNYFAGYYCAKALGALATEEENPNAAKMWNDWLDKVHFNFVQPYHEQWLSGGGAPDGWSYGQFELINMIRPIAAASTAKGLNLIHDARRPMHYFDGHVRWMTQFTWPDLNSVSDRGFVYDSDNPSWTDAGWATQYGGLLRLANGDHTPIMQRYAQELRARQGTAAIEPWAEFLFYDKAAPSEDYRTQLSYRTVGDGQVSMRNSWANDSVWAAFQSGPYTGYASSSEEFFDEGSLAIQRGGVQFLVNAWGALMRNTPGTEDAKTLFTPVYAELFGDQTDGVYRGRRLFNTYYAVRAEGYWGQDTTGTSESKHATLSRFEEGNRYVLMRGEKLEGQYASNHPISGWTRTVAYVRPNLFVVYDRTTLRNASADNWMSWHVAAAPVEVAPSGNGTHVFDVVDHRAAFGGNLFRGRVTTVLPAGNQVKSVDCFDVGKVYRLEVRTPATAATASWLTVFDAASSADAASQSAPLTAANGTVLTGQIEGTVITTAGGNTVVCFSSTGSAVVGGFSLSLPPAKTELLVADLQPNTAYAVKIFPTGNRWMVQIDLGGSLVATAEGTLSVQLSADGEIGVR